MWSAYHSSPISGPTPSVRRLRPTVLFPDQLTIAAESENHAPDFTATHTACMPGLVFFPGGRYLTASGVQGTLPSRLRNEPLVDVGSMRRRCTGWRPWRRTASAGLWPQPGHALSIRHGTCWARGPAVSIDRPQSAGKSLLFAVGVMPVISACKLVWSGYAGQNWGPALSSCRVTRARMVGLRGPELRASIEHLLFF